MSKPIRISLQTRKNWLIDAVVFLGGVLAGLSGIYFLFLPSGGYQGGRNPYYGITILFDRHTWEEIHTWGSLLMIAAVVIHFAIHWRWVKMMTRRTINAMLGKSSKLSQGAKVNVAINLVIAVSFLLCALTGLVFLYSPAGDHHQDWLLTYATWDLIHTWSGIAMIIAAVLHFWIHWRWIVNVTKRFFLSLLPQNQAPERVQVPTR